MILPEEQQKKRDYLSEYHQEPHWQQLTRSLAEIPKGSRIITFSYDTGERYLSIEGLF